MRSDHGYGAFCTKCGMLAGSSLDDDFYDEIVNIATDHMTTHMDPEHKVHLRKVPRP